jgi:hypothetical protein
MSRRLVVDARHLLVAVVTMRTLVVVRRVGSVTSPPRRRRALSSASSRPRPRRPDEPDQLHAAPERAHVVRDVGRAAGRYSSWSKATTGTGASGEMR